MFSILCYLLRGGNEEDVGLRFMPHVYGISKQYCQTIYAMLRFLYKVLRDDEFARVYWLGEADRCSQEGLLYDFPKAVDFFDGIRIKTFQTVNHHKQARQYCGHHHFH